jgi:hypothetical protein
MDTIPIRHFVELLFQPGDVFEVRAPDCRERRDARYAFTCSGYFTYETLDAAVAAIAELDRSGTAPGIYVTINPVAPPLLARAANRIKPRARETTQDKDVVRRRWLLVDVDPVRPAGICSTDAELTLALERAHAVVQYLTSVGWPAPIQAMSGNGYHLLYRIDLPADDGGLVKAVLAALADRFSDETVAVDRSVHNAARIVKVVGTVSRKGDDLRDVAGLDDRPHRRAEIVAAPEQIAPVPEERLRAVAEAEGGPRDAPRPNVAAPVANGGGANGRLDCAPAGVRAWLEARGVVVKGERRNGDKALLLLEHCPINPEIVSTGSSDIAVLVGDDGKLAYCNKHNRGQQYTWHDLRRAVDSEYGARGADESGVDLSNFAAEGKRTESSSSSTHDPIAANPPRWPEPRTIAEFDCPDSLDWIWQGWVAIAHITALVAKWKAGKTTLLHHLLCARECGGNIAGAVTPGLTLVISEEHATLWRMRSVSKTIAGHVRFICLPLVTSIQEWMDFTAHVVGLVVRDSYSLVVYDTLPGIAPIADENANSQMLAFLRPLLRLKDVGTGTLLITHPPKGHTGDDFNVRGASALMGFADQLVALKRPEGDADSTQRILKCIGRLGEPLEQTIELRGSEYVTLGTKLDIERVGRRAALQAILPAEPPGLTVEEIMAQWPPGEKAPAERTLRRFLADWLNKDGAGTKDDPTRYWW